MSPNLIADYFAGPTRDALRLAREEAQTRHHAAIGTGHILLGLVSVSDEALGRAFDRLGVDRDGVAASLAVVQPDDVPPRLGSDWPQPTFSSRSMSALQHALEVASSSGGPPVLPRHLLEGLLRLADSRAIQVLNRLRLNPNQIAFLLRP